MYSNPKPIQLISKIFYFKFTITKTGINVPKGATPPNGIVMLTYSIIYHMEERFTTCKHIILLEGKDTGDKTSYHHLRHLVASYAYRL